MRQGDCLTGANRHGGSRIGCIGWKWWSGVFG